MLLRFESSIGMSLRLHTIQILSFKASISGPADVIDVVRDAFPAASAWPAAPAGEAHLNLCVRQPGDGVWSVIEDDAITHSCHNLGELQLVLIWLINSRAVEWIGSDHLLFHAGSIAAGQTGIILPARSGSGKSTLTAALVADGCTYYSDEVAVIAPETGSLLPFPKAIKLEPDSLPVLASRFPELALRVARLDVDGQRATFLRPPDTAWPSTPVTPQLVIFPRYERGAATRLKPIRRSEAFERMLDHSFSAGNHAATGVERIVRLIQGCACCELSFGNLDEAVDQVMQLAG